MKERKTIVAHAANVKIGGANPLVVQTMCNTDTNDIEGSIAQVMAAADAGADMVRLTTQGVREVSSLARIKQRLREAGYSIPLVADVHFSSQVAIEAAKVADKVRINPGNFAKEHEKAKEAFSNLIAVCKEHDTAIRIGINHGSLGERIINLYGDTPKGMAEAAMEWIKMCIAEDFYNVVLSLKASNTVVMVTAYRLLARMMKETGVVFPLHLGVTEAGNGDTGRMKSAVGIGALLAEGLGDTIRVSLTENPVNEIYTARIIRDYFTARDSSGHYLYDIKTVNEAAEKGVIPGYHMQCASREEYLVKYSLLFGPLLLDKKIDDFKICGPFAAEEADFKENLLQASRRKFTRPEYIACPGCGRTLYNLESVFNEVKRRTSHLKGVKIAVMGCIVNGPGEMADADYGYVGEGVSKVAIYRGKEPVMRSVPQEKAIEALLELISSDGKFGS